MLRAKNVGTVAYPLIDLIHLAYKTALITGVTVPSYAFPNLNDNICLAERSVHIVAIRVIQAILHHFSPRLQSHPPLLLYLQLPQCTQLGHLPQPFLQLQRLWYSCYILESVLDGTFCGMYVPWDQNTVPKNWLLTRACEGMYISNRKYWH